MPLLYALDPFLALQAALASPWLDGPMAVISTGCEGWALALCALALAWSVERHAGVAVTRALPALGGLAATGLLVQVVKRLAATPRPLAVLGPGRVHVVMEALWHLSFPSGHAAAAAAMAAAMTARYRGQAAWLWGLAGLGGLSRVYVGAHWATDVAAGWALGAAVGLLVAHLLSGPAARLEAAWTRAPAKARLPAT